MPHTTLPHITFDVLKKATAKQPQNSAAIRSYLEMQPVGGPGSKIFPSTYVSDRSTNSRYAFETRQTPSGEITAVLLSSVAGEANHAEMALLEGWVTGELKFPVPYIDFTGTSHDIGKLTALETPHRITDAIFRDSLIHGTLFRLSEIGRAITESTPQNATALFRYCPTALLFGVWDSTGPKGGLGTKIQRAYVSEIIGLEAISGVTVQSRKDPLQISSNVPIYAHVDADEQWTVFPEEAIKDEKTGEPVLKSSKSEQVNEGKPSGINHGNVAPGITRNAGGVTVAKAVKDTTISLEAIRKIKFGSRDAAKETAAHTAIAAIGLCSIAYQHENGYDLRSRCHLIPTMPLEIELVTRDGSPSEKFSVSTEAAAKILAEAAAEAAAAGIGWETSDENLRFTPTPKLIGLIEKSKESI